MAISRYGDTVVPEVVEPAALITHARSAAMWLAPSLLQCIPPRFSRMPIRRSMSPGPQNVDDLDRIGGTARKREKQFQPHLAMRIVESSSDRFPFHPLECGSTLKSGHVSRFPDSP